MTYLDPTHQTRNRTDWRAWLVRVAAAVALVTISWFVITLGVEGNGGTRIVAEPIANGPAAEPPAAAED